MSVGQPHPSDVNVQDKHRLEADYMRVTDSNGVGASDEPDKAITEPSPVMDNNDNKAIEVALQSQQGSLTDTHAGFSFSANDFKSSSADITQMNSSNQKIKIDATSESAESIGANCNQIISLFPQASLDHGSSSNKSSFLGTEEMQIKENENLLKISSTVNAGFSHDFASKMTPQNNLATLGNGRTFHSSFDGML